MVMLRLSDVYKFVGPAAVMGLLPPVLLLQGCAQQGYSVLALTTTIIGVEVSQNPANQTPQAKLGYNRGELAFVPTNRNAGEIAGNTQAGARDTANVLMELRYGGIFDLGPSSGIYQRLAVGDIAVHEPGAAAMFIKNADGNVDPQAAAALQAVKTIPAVDPAVEAERAVLAKRFLALKNDPVSRPKFDEAAGAAGYRTFEDFAIDPETTLNKVRTIRRALEAEGITF